jgi:hypothetical protein
MSEVQRRKKKKLTAEDTLAKAEHLGLQRLAPAIIRVASQIFPYTSAAYAAYDEYNEWKLVKFLEELDAGEIELTEEDEQNYLMVHVFFSCWRYVGRTLRLEKIKLFARAFQNYCKTLAFENEETTEIYDEYLAILDDLSYREFQILCILCEFEKAIGEERRDFWSEFFDSLELKLHISRNEIPAMLQRLNRTGLYHDVEGFLSSSEGLVRGKLTPNFYVFLELLGCHVAVPSSSDV